MKIAYASFPILLILAIIALTGCQPSIRSREWLLQKSEANRLKLNMRSSIAEAGSKSGEDADDHLIIDAHGAIVRGDTSKKELALVFTGDEYADGGQIITSTLAENKIKASFFFTGRFYNNPQFTALIQQLRENGHYLGAHSDEHLLYCDWTKRDSLLVTRREFERDLGNNYKKMETFGIDKKDARYFLPPYEWYNSAISAWTRAEGLRLVNFTAGTRSTADYTWPEMGSRYVGSAEIYDSIRNYEAKNENGLNGFILLIHIGTDPRRKDKFYRKLDQLVKELNTKGYRFKKINELLN